MVDAYHMWDVIKLLSDDTCMLGVVVERTCSSCYDYLIMMLLSWMITIVLTHVHDMICLLLLGDVAYAWLMYAELCFDEHGLRHFLLREKSKLALMRSRG